MQSRYTGRPGMSRFKSLDERKHGASSYAQNPHSRLRVWRSQTACGLEPAVRGSLQAFPISVEMDMNIAIYRPDDIPVETMNWSVSSQPLIEILKLVGMEPVLPQRRLHPRWRDVDGQDSSLVYDVVEIPMQQFVENKERLHSLGFEIWPEDQDAVALLYEKPDEVLM